ncbi:MAG: hypothetical protein IJT26_03395 [Bacteroidales bacterium]|nr:hypothetical protein [Bacteroidales bacterium]
MKYGLIGEHLGHSFSREVHGMLSGEPYELRELSPAELPGFLAAREFDGINVTIPYKEAVIPHLDYVSDEARAIGAVNTIVKRDGKLFGYNTDYFGLKALAESIGVSLARRSVLILGAGGAAKTAAALARDEGAASVTHAVRTPRREGDIALREIGRNNLYEVIINATPVGMYPDVEGRIIDLSMFHHLRGVLDLVYNPIRTNLVIDAQEAGIPAAGGLMMLVAQAVKAQEFFRGVSFPEGTLQEVFGRLMRSKRNIVLTGMPSSGKSTLGKMLAERTGRLLTDTDELVCRNTGREIPDIFATDGEMEFRRLESEAVRQASCLNASIIATGGGVVLDPANIRRLKRNGRIFFVSRDIDKLVPTDDRPLSRDRGALERLFESRRNAYLASAETIIDNNDTPEAAIAQFDI